MWTQFKSAFKKVESHRRSQRELDQLFTRSDSALEDIGITRADILRAKREMKLL